MKHSTFWYQIRTEIKEPILVVDKLVIFLSSYSLKLVFNYTNENSLFLYNQWGTNIVTYNHVLKKSTKYPFIILHSNPPIDLLHVTKR